MASPCRGLSTNRQRPCVLALQQPRRRKAWTTKDIYFAFHIHITITHIEHLTSYISHPTPIKPKRPKNIRLLLFFLPITITTTTTIITTTLPRPLHRQIKTTVKLRLLIILRPRSTLRPPLRPQPTLPRRRHRRSRLLVIIIHSTFRYAVHFICWFGGVENASIPGSGCGRGVPLEFGGGGLVGVYGRAGFRGEETGAEVEVEGAHYGGAGTYDAEVYFKTTVLVSRRSKGPLS